MNDPLAQALTLPNGARFFRCALQINPFAYLKRNGKVTAFTTEELYNEALVLGCKANGIEVIAVTDHCEFKTSEGLRKAARSAGLLVFPGIEPVTKEGVHLLCLFPPDSNEDQLTRFLGECGIQGEGQLSKHDVGELLEATQCWGGLCVAAHVASGDGLLGKLKGQTRVNAWKHRLLLACSLPGPVSEAPEALRPILENKNPDHRRDRAVAVLNAQDVNDPDALATPGSSCWIKMSEVSIEGLRQAFLDPESRIRLASDPTPEPHTELLAVAWESGGFLDGAAIHFNENLNVLIGGRGTGKSTVVESLRSVLGLEALGEEARKAHEGIVRQVLRSGTKISLLVRSHRPTTRTYRFERTIPNPVVVKDEAGQILALTPADLLPRVEVYGQHEISELAKSPEKLTRLLDRFATKDASLAARKEEVERALQRSRSRVLDLQRELKQIDDRLAALPALEETLRAFQQAGLEDRLKGQSLLVREERVLKTVGERLTPFNGFLEQIRHALPIDRAFLSEKALGELPGREILERAEPLLLDFEQALDRLVSEASAALKRAGEALERVRVTWGERRTAVQAEYEKILRELQRSKVDGEEFIRLRRQLEELRPLKERQGLLGRELAEHEKQRRALLAEWEDAKSAEFRELQRAAKKVSGELAGRVRVDVTSAGNRQPLSEFLRQRIGGKLADAIRVLEQRPDLPLGELAASARLGKEALALNFSLPPAQAERIAQADAAVLMELEEIDLPHTTRIELNVAAEGQPAVWQALEALSTGQKATAVLLLLLLESDAPLIVDQPEDDLDNRFITEGVVPQMRGEKRQRQFVFATHNANVPVLGDAELIVGLSASGEAREGRGTMPPEHMGSIDARPVRELVEELLEGGKPAFETRRLKYGF